MHVVIKEIKTMQSVCVYQIDSLSFMKSPSVWKGEYAQILLVEVLIKGTAIPERNKVEVYGS